MNHWLTPATDALRVWGAFAGFIGIADAWNWWQQSRKAAALHQAFISPISLVSAKTAIASMFMGSAFMVIAGISIAMVHRVPGWTYQSQTEHMIMAFAWALLSAKAWLDVTSRHPRIIMKCVALCSLPALVFASLITSAA